MAIAPDRQARCIFEYIYFARMDSVIDEVNVYHARIVAGRALAQSYPVEADLVVGVPDSGLVAAKGYSEYSGIPYGMAFHKNSYVGRTFIKPTQKESAGIQRKDQAERYRRSSKRKEDRDGRRFDRAGYNLCEYYPDAEKGRGEGSTCKDQFAAIPASLLFWNRCAF